MILRSLVLFLFPLAASAAAFDGFPSLGNEELERLRGGFAVQIGSGMFEVSFGIERRLLVDGALVSSARLDAMQLPQGVRNVVQNSLDNRLIQQMTVIDARVRSLEALRAQHFGARVNTALLGAAR